MLVGQEVRRADVVLCGTGEFAARMLFDLAATASAPVQVLVVGRNPSRLAWLRTAANARATLFGRPAQFHTVACPDFHTPTIAQVLAAAQPRVVVQAASLQTASVLRATDNAWSQLVAQGGLSVTAAFQSVLSLHVGRAVLQEVPHARYVNACFPDVTNGVLHAAGVPVLCGVGNVAILATAFAGASGVREPGRLKLLAHYQQLARWRKEPQQREGSVPRVWLDEQEVDDVSTVFRDTMLSPQTAFDISGATGVPLILALAAGQPWRGHVPAPLGLPGGYPVQVDEHGELRLDLPRGLPMQEAVDWNARFEQACGLVIDPQGRARYTGRLQQALQALDPELAQGFDAHDVEQAAERLALLRDRLQSRALSQGH